MRTLNIIDISHWQRNLDLERVFALNPKLDGAIEKLLEVTGMCSPRVTHGCKP